MPSRKQKTRRYYDELSGSYDEVYGEEQSRKHEKILEILGNRDFETLIDIGCGTGKLLERLSTKSSRAVGIDLSIQMLRRAKERLRGSGVEFVVADASALPLRSMVADCVISVSMLESGKPSQLQDLPRTAKEGAIMVTTFFHDGNAPDAQPGFSWPGMHRIAISKRETIYVGQLPSERV